MIPKGTEVEWQGVNRKEKGIVLGHYISYIIQLKDGKCVLVDDKVLEKKEDEK